MMKFAGFNLAIGSLLVLTGASIAYVCAILLIIYFIGALL
jgi:hypothetical protein